MCAFKFGFQFVSNVSEQEYRNDPRLNFHTLLKFQRDPKAFHEGYFNDDEVTDAMRFGTALHMRILEPEKWIDNIAVYQAPINEKTGLPYGATTKTAIEFKQGFMEANAGKTIISGEDFDIIKFLAVKIKEHQLASCLLNNKIAVEQAIFANLLGVEVKGKIDALTESGLVDLKTTASLDDAFGRDKFIRAIYDYKYIVQLAFYEMILEEQSDKLDGPIPCWILAFEKQSPNRIAVYKIDDDVILSAKHVVATWLSRWKQAQDTGFYTSKYYNDIQIIDKYDWSKDL